MRSMAWPSTTEPRVRAAGTGSKPGLLPALAFRLGRTGYREAAVLQHDLVQARLRGAIPDTFLLLEHPPTITLGRASHAEHLIAPESVLAARGIEVHETSRGGDVTYHGPGQLVGYGIVDLRDHGRDVALYLRRLEAALIALLAGRGVAAGRHPEHTGVWVGGSKIAAIGVRVDRWVTSHGFALNVATDLSHFDLIVPCGIRGRGVTSLERLAAAGPAPASPDDALECAARDCEAALGREFGWSFAAGDPSTLPRRQPEPGERILGGVRRIFPGGEE